MLHHLMVGTWTPPGAIFSFEFDDEAVTLKLVKRIAIPHDEPISWMTFDHARKNIYGASMKTWSSYAVRSPTDIAHTASHPISGHPLAADESANTRAIFVLAAHRPPYHIYGNPFYDYAGHGNVLATDSTGALESHVQDYAYEPASGVHGMVLDPATDEGYLYSADLRANKLWTHRVEASTGRIERMVSCEDAPEEGDRPRWVEVHPDGRYLYVLMEAGNRLAEYALDAQTRQPRFTGRAFPLIPEDVMANKSNYRGDLVALSHSARYLFASTRSNTLDVPGYISAYRLAPSGAIEAQLLLQPTTSSGGHSNAVAPCPWSDEWVALTDDTVGFVEMYRWREERLEVVARCEVREPGFGMNAIWYD